MSVEVVTKALVVSHDVLVYSAPMLREHGSLVRAAQINGARRSVVAAMQSISSLLAIQTWCAAEIERRAAKKDWDFFCGATPPMRRLYTRDPVGPATERLRAAEVAEKAAFLAVV